MKKKYSSICPFCHLKVAKVGQDKGRCTNTGCGKRLPEERKEMVKISQFRIKLGCAFVA